MKLFFKYIFSRQNLDYTITYQVFYADFLKFAECLHTYLWYVIDIINPLQAGLLNTTLCDKVYPWSAAGWWFSLGTPVSYTNKTDRHVIAEILLKVVLNTITLTPPLIPSKCLVCLEACVSKM
jgi:hypothetical protein